MYYSWLYSTKERNILRIFLIILLNFGIILADNLSILKSKDESVGCKIILSPKDKSKCNGKSAKKISIAPIVIHNDKDKRIEQLTKELNSLKKEFMEYKDSKDKDTQKLNDIIKQFVQYKIDKENKIKKLKIKLGSIRKELYKNKRRLITIQKSIKKEHIKKKIRKKKIQKTIKKIVKIKKKKTLERINKPWVEIVVEDDLDIYQLALKYYKDKREYKQIYLANRDIIGKSLKIRNGMSLKIPITDKFEEQPMLINIDR